MVIYFEAVGVKATLENLDEAKVISLWRQKGTTCCICPNIIGLRPTEEWLRIANYSKGTVHHFQDAFIEEKYVALTTAIDTQERERLAREIGDHLFAEFADIPLLLLFNEVVANPKVVGGWEYPGPGAGRTTHFHLLQAVK